MASNFSTLLKNNKTAIVSQTMKVPADIDMFASDVAAQLDVSKHEVLVAMLRDGADIARERYAREDALQTSDPLPNDDNNLNYFMLNTNKSQDEDTHNWMVEDKIAAAFCDPWKFKIERIKDGDIVFHYESGAGIVGFGTAVGKVQKTNYYGNDGDTFFYKLENYKKLDNPVPAKKIKEMLNRKIPFASTLINLRDGEVLKAALS
ncbi:MULTISPECIES: EVE domain-containing protein [Enterobacter]|jgi:hypothetical protein|uniref:hypothetical protein n=1 Tax=Enterobacter TaxID=547 RepID=UPI00237956FE|nr:hypothetical protein [Enterobacter kobei]MDD9221848.1 hypothetical protein [Enterobacter kobei]